jgi:hypothetical protein
VDSHYVHDIGRESGEIDIVAYHVDISYVGGKLDHGGADGNMGIEGLMAKCRGEVETRGREVLYVDVGIDYVLLAKVGSAVGMKKDVGVVDVYSASDSVSCQLAVYASVVVCIVVVGKFLDGATEGCALPGVQDIA